MNAKAIDSSAVLPWVSALPPEVWALIGEQLRSREMLRVLVGMCRKFRVIFTPILHAQYAIQLSDWEPSELGSKELPPTLKYTKDLEIVFSELRMERDYEIAMNKDYVSFVNRMLMAMPNLKSFKWEDSAFEKSYGPSLILQDAELLRILKGRRSLKNLSIQFASQFLHDHTAAHNCFTSLVGFRNLTSLELYHFFGNIEDRLTKEIAFVVSECPGLKTFGLGMACDFDTHEIIIVKEPEFLEKLCMNYESYGKPPLPLQTLRLGEGICLSWPTHEDVGNYLAKLVQTSALKTLHVYNGLAKYNSEDANTVRMHVNWVLLQDCTSLQQVAISRIDENIVEWLNSGRTSVEELLLMDHYYWDDEDLEAFSALRLPHLKMIITHERSGSLGTYDDSSDESAWSDTESSVSSSSESGSSGTASIETAKADFFPPILTPDKSMITVLDRLADGGSQLTKLSLCLDLETQWVHFSSHLPHLRHLTELRLEKKSHQWGQYPTKASSLWPGIVKIKEIANCYAKLICSACPSIRFIGIGAWVWQAITQDAKHSALAESGVHLRELDLEEISNIDPFVMESFAAQSGLPVIGKPRKPISEDDALHMELIIQEAEAARRDGTLAAWFDGQDDSDWDD